MSVPMSSRLAAEALGTGMLVCTVVGSGIMAAKLTGDQALALLCNTLPTGAILVVLITMLGPISGAHFNPAVSLIMRLRGEITSRELGGYVVTQVLGGCVGTLIAHMMFGLDLWQFSQTARTGMAQWFAEFIAAFGLLVTILGTLKARPEMVPASVGLYITAAYWFTASTSFANPAVTIARALSNTFAGIAPSHVAAFVAAQLCGAVAGWIASDLLFARSSNNV